MTYRVLFFVPALAAILVGMGGGCATKPIDIGDFLDGNDGGGPAPFQTRDAASEDAASDGVLCPATSCPEPYLTCQGSRYMCEVDPRIDNQNCGRCGNVCPNDPVTKSVLHASWTCSEGACLMVCEPDYLDANSDARDGCEMGVLCDPANCGDVGNACGAGVPCIRGSCGCPVGLALCEAVECGASFESSCFDLQRYDRHCGACGNNCLDIDTTGLHSTLGYRCDVGECKLTCVDGYRDCNKDLDRDGCEVSVLFDDQNCGSCGNVCPAGQVCFAGKCECTESTVEPGPCQCGAGRAFCESFGGPFGFHARCVDLENDSSSCGFCHHACDTGESCRYGRCVRDCLAGYADCNSIGDDGCEVAIDSDPRNCGGCGIACDLFAGQPCIRGQCATVPCNQGPTR
ncbi:MAG: Tryptophan synthase alpha chain [Labilithrix sp.]|nr:Tryptophan synthase alpha chain [Labilithrix sp.]